MKHVSFKKYKYTFLGFHDYNDHQHNNFENRKGPLETRVPLKLRLIERFHSRGQHLYKFIGTKRKYLHEKRVKPPEDFLGTPIWPP